MSFWHREIGLEHIDHALKEGHPDAITADDLTAARLRHQLPLGAIVDLNVQRVEALPPEPPKQPDVAPNLGAVLMQAEQLGAHVPMDEVVNLRAEYERTGICPPLEYVVSLVPPVAPPTPAEIAAWAQAS